MDRRKMLALLGISPALAAGTRSLAGTTVVAASEAHSATPAEPKLTVLSPMGTPPPIKLLAMAPRLKSLDRKTIYIVDDGYVGGDVLLKEMAAWFNRNIPTVNAVYRRKAGGFPAEDPALWAEIKAKGDAVVMGIGH
jgi:hypothetical protein